MVCKECGKEITDETLGYCPECLAPLEEPVVINMSKDDIKKANKDFEKKAKEEQKKVVKNPDKEKTKSDNPKEKDYDGPFIDLVGYIKDIGMSLTNLLGFLGAIFLYLSPFMTWIWEVLYKIKKKGNLFDMGEKKSDMSLNSSNITIMAVLFLVSGFFMMVFIGREHIKPIWRLRNNFIVRLLPGLVSAFAFWVVITDKHYVEAMNNMKAQNEVAKVINSSSNQSFGRGLGPIICIVGISLYVLSVLIDLLKYMKNKR